MSATIWHDPLTDEWSVRDGDLCETLSPLVRQVMVREHERLTRELNRECDDWCAMYDRLKAENAKLRELLLSYWKRAHSPAIPNVERDYLKEMRELGIEVD